jgi:hypothetical protein
MLKSKFLSVKNLDNLIKVRDSSRGESRLDATIALDILAVAASFTERQ